MATVLDRKTGYGSLNGEYAGFKADIASATDYYPFGMEMPGRSFSSANSRFGFNGQEKDNEVKGTGNSYAYEARMYDTRIGRWLSLDPLSAKYPDQTPYSFVINNPIIMNDPDGKKWVITREPPGKDGKPTIVISYTGKIRLDVSKTYTKEQLEAIKERMISSYKEAYTGSGATINWRGEIDLTFESPENPALESDHIVHIVKNGEVPSTNTMKIPWENDKEYLQGGTNFGYAVEYKKFAYVNEKILFSEPTKNPQNRFFGTGLTADGTATLERTFSHENGHSAGNVEHPAEDSRPGNLMHPSRNTKRAGMRFDEDQVLQMESDYKNDKLNKGRQVEDQMYKPKKTK